MSKIRIFLQSLTGILLVNFIFAASFVAAQSVSSIQPNAQNIGISSNVSENWSGYVSDNGNFTSITATWNVPNPTATANLSADAAWIGIGGVSTNDLIQAGTQTIIQNGQTVYKLWYETLPNSAVSVPLNIKPGDSVTVSMTETSPNNWQISYANNSTGQNYIQNVQYTSSHSSAEWIEEMPTLYSSGSFIPLDNFGTISFMNGSATMNGNFVNIAATNPIALTMASRNNGMLLVSPSTLVNGSSFSLTRSSNQPLVSNNPGSSTVRITVGGWGGRGGERVQSLTGNPFRIQRQIIRQFINQYGRQFGSISWRIR